MLPKLGVIKTIQIPVTDDDKRELLRRAVPDRLRNVPSYQSHKEDREMWYLQRGMPVPEPVQTVLDGDVAKAEADYTEAKEALHSFNSEHGKLAGFCFCLK